jgi:sugar-specific transcriptional regulator TrmB
MRCYKSHNTPLRRDCHLRLATVNALQFWLAAYAWGTFRTAMENLTKLGLSEKEALLYLLLLRNGPAPASILAKRLKIKRVSLYPIAEALMARGLATFETTPVGRRYIPYDPECLLEILEKENSELRYRMDLARRCIDQLRSLSVAQELEPQFRLPA